MRQFRWTFVFIRTENVLQLRKVMFHAFSEEKNNDYEEMTKQQKNFA